MAKSKPRSKKSNLKIKRKLNNSSAMESKDQFIDEINKNTRAIFHGMILPVEQRVTALLNEIETIKANLITVTTLLEKKKIINRDEFMNEFAIYGNEVGLVKNGIMDGEPIITLYNQARI